ncbi:hypothetical protein B0H17DRAFT_1193455 [Mycena rosella]|uniref:F-box domain-containing protein n=1 Tax=Mycena rosella TaxID=1033263 RepID=A0AAD7M7M5_MYCRO|nr:hypothetical protein B0H17DRAFT_1193455 [Mycena rosella]
MADPPPVFILPPELTATIFAHCLQSSRRWPSPHDAPLLLAQIYHEWREICLDTPDLWTSIALGEIGSVHLLEQWISRAKNRPLSIVLETRGDIRAGELMETVLPHCSRWEDVCFLLRPSSYHQLSMSHHPFPILRRIALSGDSIDDEEGLILIRNAPLLREVRLDSPTYAKVDLPWDQLTSMNVRSFPNAAQTLAALRRCPDMRHFHCLWTSGQPPFAITPLILHSLRSLSIRDMSVLPFLMLPRLERLEIGNILDGAFPDVLQSLVSRSSCALKFLGVVNRPNTLPPSAFESLFQAASSITSLQLHFLYPSGFRQHIAVLAAADVLPRLERLEIRDSAGGDYYGPLLRVLRSRRTVAVELSLGTRAFGSAAQGQGRVPPEDIMAKFRPLAEAGLKLRIETREQGGPRVIFDSFKT